MKHHTNARILKQSVPTSFKQSQASFTSGTRTAPHSPLAFILLLVNYLQLTALTQFY